MKRLDELQTFKERKASVLKKPLERRIFLEGRDREGPDGRPYQDLRWSDFKSFEPRDMFTVVDEHVFPFCATLAVMGPPLRST